MAASNDKVIILIIVIGAFVVFGMAVIIMLIMAKSTPDFVLGSLAGRVALVEVTGVIEDPENIVRQLKKYEDDNSVKALVLRINSPGGGVAASQEIYDQLLKFRDKDKIIVASMGSVAASGGYYISCAADTIFANGGTITGSIGVIFSFFVFEDLMNKAGVGLEVVKSGELKDVGSPARELAPKEREMLQSVIDDTYGQFIDIVAERRGLDIDYVKGMADGSIFTGHQALEKGLVDKIGTLDDAIAKAGEMANLGDNPRVVKERPFRPNVWEQIFGALGLDFAKAGLNRTWPGLEYRYQQ
jgi:protease-4